MNIEWLLELLKLLVVNNAREFLFWDFDEDDRIHFRLVYDEEVWGQMTEDNLDDLKQAFLDIAAVDNNDIHPVESVLLFCIRQMKECPPRDFYDFLDERFFPLFEEYPHG